MNFLPCKNFVRTETSDKYFLSTEASMMNMREHDPHLLMFLKFKLGHNVSEISTNINRARGDGLISNQTLKISSRNSVV